MFNFCSVYEVHIYPRESNLYCFLAYFKTVYQVHMLCSIEQRDVYELGKRWKWSRCICKEQSYCLLGEVKKIMDIRCQRELDAGKVTFSLLYCHSRVYTRNCKSRMKLLNSRLVLEVSCSVEMEAFCSPEMLVCSRSTARNAAPHSTITSLTCVAARKEFTFTSGIAWVCWVWLYWVLFETLKYLRLSLFVIW
jgi:hypothetical protein